jgi:hypothetical protein
MLFQPSIVSHCIYLCSVAIDIDFWNYVRNMILELCLGVMHSIFFTGILFDRDKLDSLCYLLHGVEHSYSTPFFSVV